MSLAELISTYGYAAIGIGTFLEGETILILGGLAAHRGYLELPWVIVCAFLGTLFGDQLFFYLGRIKGKEFLEKRPHWKIKSDKVFTLLDRHQVWVILGFRFLYGLRTVTPFIIGASRVSPLRFLILNIIGAAIWASVVGTLGYLLGNTVELLMGNIKKYELLLFAILAGVGVSIWLVKWYKRTTSKPIRALTKDDAHDDGQ
jgi:membrane protein DedA with SNARE-associated domain